ncbi:lysozyme inhibitor LprI family protein, partial [Ralstonia pseudosolanacearum]
GRAPRAARRGRHLQLRGAQVRHPLGAAMAFDRTVRAHQLYRQAECDLARRLARNTPDADLAEAACDADLSRERIGALREATYPATPAPNPAAAPAKP